METTESDLLEIVTTSKSFMVSKKLLCSSIPYFEKMFCHDLLESRENKVILAFDAAAFNNILSFVHSNYFALKMKNVLPTYDCCEYLMIDDLKTKCSEFFYKNFTIEHLPTLIPSLSVYSKLITPQMINCFIRRHFLRISYTEAFLNFPFDLIEYICKLDLIVDSEYQVFDSIARWYEKNKTVTREDDFMRLMKCIRWCFLDKNDLVKIKSNKTVVASKSLEAIMCLANDCKNNCKTNRVVVNSPLAIFKVDESTVDILILDETEFCFPCGQFKLDTTLDTSIITDEHIIDVFYDSFKKGIRVNWKEKKFRYFDLSGSDESYFGQFYRYIEYDSTFVINIRKSDFFLTDPVEETKYETFLNSTTILHSLCYSMVTGLCNDKKKVYVLAPLVHRSWFYGGSKNDHHKACAINNLIYIIDENLEMYKVNINTKSFEKSHLKDSGFKYEDIQLFNYGDQILLFNESNNSIYNYDDYDWSLSAKIETSNKLIAISSIYSPSGSTNSLYIVK